MPSPESVTKLHVLEVIVSAKHVYTQGAYSSLLSSVCVRARVSALLCMGPCVRVYILYIVCDTMGIFYKYIYTQILLCRSSWGSGLQFTACFLDPAVYPGLAGVRGQSVGGERTHTHSPVLLPQAITLRPHLPSPDAASWGPEYWFVVTLVYFSTDCPYLMIFLFTLPILGTDLHCDSRPPPLTTPGLEERGQR